MAGKNISDMIENYLKKILANDEKIEISRSQIASLFDVVPSQINYVINTRFTIQNGYIVESKRGGGGYIRIEKVNILDGSEILDSLIEIVGNQLTLRDSESIVQTLYNSGLVSKREAHIILAATKQNDSNANNELINVLRANIMVSILNHLRYEK